MMLLNKISLLLILLIISNISFGMSCSDFADKGNNHQMKWLDYKISLSESTMKKLASFDKEEIIIYLQKNYDLRVIATREDMSVEESAAARFYKSSSANTYYGQFIAKDSAIYRNMEPKIEAKDRPYGNENLVLLDFETGREVAIHEFIHYLIYKNSNGESHLKVESIKEKIAEIGESTQKSPPRSQKDLAKLMLDISEGNLKAITLGIGEELSINYFLLINKVKFNFNNKSVDNLAFLFFSDVKDYIKSLDEILAIADKIERNGVDASKLRTESLKVKTEFEDSIKKILKTNPEWKSFLD